jgi:hypothetical protein
MIIFVSVNFKRLLKQERAYHWPRPELCPCCQASDLWGHGFVAAYFDGLARGVYLRRYRCPGCGCVIRLRPRGYFRRFQAAIVDIFHSLRRRIRTGSYMTGISRSRQRHWLVGLRRHSAAYLDNRFSDRLPEAFLRLWQMGFVPVSRGI